MGDRVRQHDKTTIWLARELVDDGFQLGSIAHATGGWQLYASSKAALNMLMKGYAAKHFDDGHALLLVAPGWVRTEMGGGDAALSVAESIPRVVDMIEANRGLAGLRYVDRFNNPLPW